MINIKEQIEWLEDWIQDDPEGLGKDLDTRTFNALEVAMIMQIYKDEQLILSGVSQQSELLKLKEFIDKQKDLPSEISQIVNDNFWDLL